MDVVWKAVCEKDITLVEFDEVPPQCDDLERKSLEVPLPVQSHSVPRDDQHPISSAELGAGFEASNYPYRHAGPEFERRF